MRARKKPPGKLYLEEFLPIVCRQPGVYNPFPHPSTATFRGAECLKTPLSKAIQSPLCRPRAIENLLFLEIWSLVLPLFRYRLCFSWIDMVFLPLSKKAFLGQCWTKIREKCNYFLKKCFIFYLKNFSFYTVFGDNFFVSVFLTTVVLLFYSCTQIAFFSVVKTVLLLKKKKKKKKTE